MKIKQDFVTNSSSTSFVAWGITIDMEQLKKKYGRKIFEKEHMILEPELYNRDLEEFFEGEFPYEVQELLEKRGLEARGNYDYDNIFIGESPFKMEDNQTLQEFKEGIIKKMHEAGLDDITINDLHVIEECWMDN